MELLFDAARPLYGVTGRSSSGTLVYVQSLTGHINIGFLFEVLLVYPQFNTELFCNLRYIMEVMLIECLLIGDRSFPRWSLPR